MLSLIEKKDVLAVLATGFKKSLVFLLFLLMFPAWTYHAVEMNMEDRDRISIAFNLVDSQPKTRIFSPTTYG